MVLASKVETSLRVCSYSSVYETLTSTSKVYNDTEDRYGTKARKHQRNENSELQTKQEVHPTNLPSSDQITHFIETPGLRSIHLTGPRLVTSRNHIPYYTCNQDFPKIPIQPNPVQ